ncbi:MAG TPA: hypothetical protein VK698_29220 [Kofleriaceae bacterium]|nr:hypothetical protein [Kofleriaceae bacterium]
MSAPRGITRQLARPGAALFAFVLIAYAYFYQAGGWNQNSRFDLTRAIVERGTASIDAYHWNTGDKARVDGHYYCEKAPGVSWLAVPAHAAWTAAVGAAPDRIDDAAYVSTLWAVALPAALAVPLLLWLLGMLGCPPGASLIATAAYALATLAWPHATLFYGQQPSATLSLAGFALAVAAALGRLPARRALVAAGAALGASVMADYPAALCAIAVAVYAAVRCRRRVGWLVLGGALPVALLAAYHASVFGGPLHLPYEHSLMRYRHQGFFMGLGRPDAVVLFNILVSPFRGLLFSAPWLLLAVPGAVRMWRTHRAEAALCAAVPLLYLWMNGSMVDPYGGWAVGPRFLVPALPFAAALAGFALVPPASRRVGRVLAGGAAALIAYSALMMLATTAVKPELPVAIAYPFGDFLLPSLAGGQLAINQQGIDMAAWALDGPPRAWNLGQLLGLDGLASLAPLGAAAALAGLWLARGWRLRSREISATRPPG